VAVLRQLEKELKVIKGMGFPATSSRDDFIDYAKSKDIPVAGRGSAAGSLVAIRSA